MENLINGIFNSPFADWLVLTTGIINLFSALFLLLTCRFMPHLAVSSRWMSYGWYKFLYKYHSYVWWLFAPSLLMHAFFTITHIMLGG